MRGHRTILFFLCIFLFSCHPRPKDAGPGNRSFYYWKSIFSLSGAEKQALQDLRVHRLYIRFFDVGWDERVGRAAPIGTIRFRDSSFRAFLVTPVVFITNETLLHLDTAEVGLLASNAKSRNRF